MSQSQHQKCKISLFFRNFTNLSTKDVSKNETLKIENPTQNVVTANQPNVSEFNISPQNSIISEEKSNIEIENENDNEHDFFKYENFKFQILNFDGITRHRKKIFGIKINKNVSEENIIKFSHVLENYKNSFASEKENKTINILTKCYQNLQILNKKISFLKFNSFKLEDLDEIQRDVVKIIELIVTSNV